MRDISPIVRFHQFLLFGRPSDIQINHDELHAALVLLIEIYRAASLAFGIEAPFAKENNVIRLAPDRRFA